MAPPGDPHPAGPPAARGLTEYSTHDEGPASLPSVHSTHIPEPLPPSLVGARPHGSTTNVSGKSPSLEGNYAKARRVQTAHVPTPHRLRCRRSELRPSLRKFPQSAAKLKRPREYAHSDPAAQSALRDPKSSPHLSWSQDSPPTSTKLDLHLDHSLSQGGVAQGHSVAMRAPWFRFRKRPSMQQSLPPSVDKQLRGPVAHVGQVPFAVDAPGPRLPVPLSRAEVDEPIVTVSITSNVRHPHVANLGCYLHP